MRCKNCDVDLLDARTTPSRSNIRPIYICVAFAPPPLHNNNIGLIFVLKGLVSVNDGGKLYILIKI